MPEKLQVGDWVQWTSQAGGRGTVKTGVIVRVIPPYEPPSKETFERVAEEHGAGTRKWGGAKLSRPRTSYYVMVSTPGSGKMAQIYWPDARRLEKTEKPA